MVNPVGRRNRDRHRRPSRAIESLVAGESRNGWRRLERRQRAAPDEPRVLWVDERAADVESVLSMTTELQAPSSTALHTPYSGFSNALPPSAECRR